MTQDEGAAGRTAGGRSRRVRIDRTAAKPLSAQTQQRLGLHLRALYDAVVEQPVPDRFKDLIAQLDGPAGRDVK